MRRWSRGRLVVPESVREVRGLVDTWGRFCAAWDSVVVGSAGGVRGIVGSEEVGAAAAVRGDVIVRGCKLVELS